MLNYLEGLLAGATSRGSPPQPKYGDGNIYSLGRIFRSSTYENDDFTMSTASPPLRSSNKLRVSGKSVTKDGKEPSRFAEFEQFFAHIPWLSYREKFPPLLDREHGIKWTSDAGWGCMLRTGQMLLATALIKHMNPGPLENTDPQLYRMILSWFNDHHDAPYSLHAIAHRGVDLGKSIGRWFGPSTISAALRFLNVEHEESTVRILNVVSTVISAQDVFALCRDNPKHSHWSCGLLVLIPSRLGLNGVNPIYLTALKEYMKLPHSLGFIGGKPNASFYFVGVQGNTVFYLDPHTTQPMALVDMDDSEGDISSYFCSQVRAMNIADIDESLALGFYIRDEVDWNLFVSEVRELHSRKDFSGFFEIEVVKAEKASTGSHMSDAEIDDFEIVGDDDFVSNPSNVPNISYKNKSKGEKAKISKPPSKQSRNLRTSGENVISSKDDFDMSDFDSDSNEEQKPSSSGSQSNSNTPKKKSKKKTKDVLTDFFFGDDKKSHSPKKEPALVAKDKKGRKLSMTELDTFQSELDSVSSEDEYYREKFGFESESQPVNIRQKVVRDPKDIVDPLGESVSAGFEFVDH